MNERKYIRPAVAFGSLTLKKTVAATLVFSLLFFCCAGAIASPILRLVLVERKTLSSLQEQIPATQRMINDTSKQIDYDSKAIESLRKSISSCEKLRSFKEVYYVLTVRLFGANSDLAIASRKEISDLNLEITILEIQIDQKTREVSSLEEKRLGYIEELNYLHEMVSFLQERARSAKLVTIPALLGLAAFIVLASKEKRRLRPAVRVLL